MTESLDAELSEPQQPDAELPQFVVPKSTLERFDLRPKKSFGQNFLTDPHLADRIVELAGAERAHVLEIGAGLGGLTARLLAHGHRVTAIERDRDLVPILRELFRPAIDTHELSVLEMDAKAVDLPTAFEPNMRRVLMGNLPYQITGPLLQAAVRARVAIDVAVFLVQKEVADRLVAAPSSKTYGALSVFCQAGFCVERSFIVRRGAFYPQPNVDSAVVTLKPLAEPHSDETETFRAVVVGAFRERRKVLRNAWKGVCNLTPDELQRAAANAGIALEARGETLDVQAFARMTRAIDALRAGGSGE